MGEGASHGFSSHEPQSHSLHLFFATTSRGDSKSSKSSFAEQSPSSYSKMVHKGLTLIVRFFQLVFAIIVLSLSAAAVRWQYRNSVPPINGYACFAGAMGCLAALMGFMALLIDAIAGVIMLCLDSLATVFMLAGGIVSPSAHMADHRSLTLFRHML